MLAFAEDYIGRTRVAANDHDIAVILGNLAVDLGYRSGYLIEYACSLKAAILVLDSDMSRAGHWEAFVSSGLRTRTRAISEMLAKGGVQYLSGERFSGPEDPMLAFARRVDAVDSAVVPINFDHDIVGQVGFCGAKRLTTEQEMAVQFVCYNLFLQVRSFHTHGIKAVGAGLTPRERQVMELSAEGLTSQQVATQLGMSPRTVNQHMDNVADKLGTRNRVHTVAEAIRRDLL